MSGASEFEDVSRRYGAGDVARGVLPDALAIDVTAAFAEGER